MREINYLPRCYSFSFDVETMTLFLKIQKWAVPDMQAYFRNERSMADMYASYGGDNKLFVPFGEKDQPFGWDDSIVWHGETEDEIVYSYTITPTVEQTDEICSDCKGTKKGKFLDYPCRPCRATGKKYIPAKRQFTRGLLSLQPVIREAGIALLRECGKQDKPGWVPPTKKKQTVAMVWTHTAGMGNCSMTAWVDEKAAKKIPKLPDAKIKEVIDAMQRTEMVLDLRERNIYGYRFDCHSEDVFGLQVPGDACHLMKGRMGGLGMFGSIGKTMQPHNVDNRYQQFEFLVGLAKMNDVLEQPTRVSKNK